MLCRFFSNDNKFFYALGAIKNVGYEAIQILFKERIKMVI